MQWWDTSAVLALVLKEKASATVEAVLAADAALAVWWGTKVEAVSGICRGQRAGSVRATSAADPHRDMERLLASALTIAPWEEVRVSACGLLRAYDLSAADALQLAAALVWVEHQPRGAGFVCLDRRLCEAAAREGFRILPEE
jgi:predicted nucleic acid-binding protein